MQLTRKRLPKPTFDVFEKAYRAGGGGLHVCPVASPSDAGAGRDTWTTRMCEALMVAAQIVESRSEIGRSTAPLLGDYSFGLHGRMCPHGVGVDAPALSTFLSAEWGEPVKLTGGDGAAEKLQSKVGVIYFSGQRSRGIPPHMDLWNGEKCLGRAFWEADVILFWELRSGAGSAGGSTGGGGLVEKVAEKLDWIPKAKPTPPTSAPEEDAPERHDEKPALRLEYEAKVRGLKDKIPKMRKEGFDDETIARALHAERRELGVKYKDLTPPKKLAEIYQRNIDKYGDKLGPSIEYLRDVKKKSWDQIMESACTPGGKDLKFGS